MGTTSYNNLYWPPTPEQQRSRPVNDEHLPIRKLAMSMIIEALNDVIREQPKHEATALYWIFNRDKGYSFDVCCEVLDIDPDALREHIEKTVNEGRKADLVKAFQFRADQDPLVGSGRREPRTIREAVRMQAGEGRRWLRTQQAA